MGKFLKKIKTRHTKQEDYQPYDKFLKDLHFITVAEEDSEYATNSSSRDEYKSRLMNAYYYSDKYKPYDIIEVGEEFSDLCNYLVNNRSFMDEVHASIPLTKIPLPDISYITKDGGYYRLFTSSSMMQHSELSETKIDKSGLLYIELHFSEGLILITEINLLDLDKEIKHSPVILSKGDVRRDKDFDYDRFDIIVMDMLQIWAMTQVLYLNPICKEVLYTRNEEIRERSNINSNSHKRPNKIKYIRKIYVNKPVIKSLLSVRHHNITCDCWYVIGHWRHYKTGKKVWVEGYWKGRNRDLKNSKETRIRELPTNEVMEKYC